MATVRISELKASLSRYVDRVRRGEEVIVTDRGNPVAKLVPIGEQRLDVTAHFKALEREGVVRRGGKRLPKDYWKRPRPKDATGSVRQALLEEREDR